MFDNENKDVTWGEMFQQQERKMSANVETKRQAFKKTLNELEIPGSIKLTQTKRSFIQMPKNSRRTNLQKTLVLDLDHTLANISATKPLHNQFTPISVLVGKSLTQLYLTKRPHLDQFLKELSTIYEIWVFSTEGKEYTRAVVNSLNKDGCITGMLNRDHCVVTLGNKYLKDVRVLEKNMKDVVLLDDSLQHFNLYPRNGLHISKFCGELEDEELVNLLEFLKNLATKNDVRSVSENYKKYSTFQDEKANHKLGLTLAISKSRSDVVSSRPKIIHPLYKKSSMDFSTIDIQEIDNPIAPARVFGSHKAVIKKTSFVSNGRSSSSTNNPSSEEALLLRLNSLDDFDDESEGKITPLKSIEARGKNSIRPPNMEGLMREYRA